MKKRRAVLRIVLALLIYTNSSPSVNANDIQEAISKARQAQLDYEKRVKEAEAKASRDKENLDKAAAKKLTDRDVLRFCKNIGDCKRGEIGPAGGFIFYVAPEPTEWGR